MYLNLIVYKYTNRLLRLTSSLFLVSELNFLSAEHIIPFLYTFCLELTAHVEKKPIGDHKKIQL